MAVVTSDYLVATYQGLRAIYEETFENTKPEWDKIAMEAPSTTESEVYSWVAEVPGMKEWVDERTLEALKQFSFTIKNKDWESTIAVDRNAMEDNKLGQIKPRIQDLGMAAKAHPDELVFTLLGAGFSSTCFDGQFFFDDDHPLANGTTQSNKLTLALDATGLQSALAIGRRLKGYTGRPLNIIFDTLAVPPELEITARKLLFADRDNNGATNILKGVIPNLVVNPYLADTNNWFILCTKRPLKPMILQMRKRPEFLALDKPDDYNAFMKKQFLYGVDARYNIGYGMYQLAVGSEVA